MALAVPLSRFTSRVGGGSAFFVRRLRVSHMNQTLHYFYQHFWIDSAIAAFFALLAYIKIWHRNFWLRLLDAEESFWLRFGLSKGGWGRRFSESRFCTISLVVLAVAFLLLAAFQAFAYFHFLHRLH